MKANYHTHTKLCGHAIGMSEDYVLEAIKNGFEEIGFSDHGPIPRTFMSPKDYQNNMLDRQMDEHDFNKIYLPDIEKSKSKYSSKISIKKGLEIEYIEGKNDYYQSLLKKLDYLSLGVHYFKTPFGMINTYDSNSKYYIDNYAETVERALATGYFKVINHPDIYLLNYYDDSGKYIFDKKCEIVARRIIEAAIKNGVCLEINGGGPRRGNIYYNGEKRYAYPRDEFWKIVQEYKEAKVIFGCDTHNPIELYDDVIKDIENKYKQYSYKIVEKLNF